MSCYRPITINNPKLVKNNIFDKAQIEVPCGKCHSCLDGKRLSWFVRLFYEWQYCISCGGFGLFETLTYNNAHLPYLFLPNEDKVPCFSTRHVQLYLKRIRKRLSSLYSEKVDFKYFLSMEYGGKTHRPHYHVIFFVSSPFVDRLQFKKIVESLWHENGFTKSGYDLGFVSAQGGLSYCAKYVCKDLYEDKYFRNLGLKFQMLGLDRSFYKEFFPHNMQSINLGVYALEFDKLNDLNSFFDGVIHIADKKEGVRTYKLPLYYDRKLFYDVKYRYYDKLRNEYYCVDSINCLPVGVDYSPIYLLNDLGLEMKEKRLEKTLDAVANVYRCVMVLPSYMYCYINKLNEKFNQHFESIKDFQNHIKSSVSEELFVAYSVTYRGCKSSDVVCDCSCNNLDVYRDTMLIHGMSRGLRPLSVDYNSFCHNVNMINEIPHLSDNYNMIRFMYFLIHTEMENYWNKKEYAYIDQKTVHLLSTENIV